MIIDIFKDKKFFHDLEVYNKEIFEVCSRWKYDYGDDGMDLEKGIVSRWFDPANRRNLVLSENYPERVPLMDDPKFNLEINFYSYPPLYIYNKLFADRKDVLIEDSCGGIGKFIHFLDKTGFTNFNLVDDFSQTCQAMWEEMMQKSGIICGLNYDNYPVEVLNLSSYPVLFRVPFPSSLELFSCYYHEGMIQQKNGRYQFRNNSAEYYDPHNFKFLCKDSDNLMWFFCREDKFDQFSEILSRIPQ